MFPNIVNEGVLGSKDNAEGTNNFVTGCAIGEVDSPFASLSSRLGWMNSEFHLNVAAEGDTTTRAGNLSPVSQVLSSHSSD